MFCVFDELTGRVRKKSRTLAILAVVVAALAIGPGFFAYALIDALYRDLPYRATQHRGALLSSVPSANETDGWKLRPLFEAKPSLDDISLAAQGYIAEENPFGGDPNLGVATSEFPSSPISDEEAGIEQFSQKLATYRTVCVRLCDGFYFPMSFAALPSEFAEQEAQCNSRCDSPARLFVYPNAGGTPAAMRDLEGNEYRGLKTAFRFQAKFDSACSCRPQPWTLAAKERHIAYAAAKIKQQTARIVAVTEPVPAQAPSLGEARELAASRAGSTLRTQSPAAQQPVVAAAAIVEVEDLPPKFAVATTDELSARMADKAERAAVLAAVELPPNAFAWKGRDGPRAQQLQNSWQSAQLPGFFALFAPASPLKVVQTKNSMKVAGSAASKRREALGANEILLRNLNSRW
jgi:Protein of unknown function (DUF2865)